MLSTNIKECRAQVAALLENMPKDANKCQIKPHFTFGMWRGKDAYLSGYQWSRIGSNYLSGRVYETILGHGSTPEAAIEMMTSKLK